MTNDNESLKQRVSHTPGPFWYQRGVDGCDELFEIWAPGKKAPTVSLPFWSSDVVWAAETQANARLFAAAPDLLSAVKLAHEWMSSVAGNLYGETETRRVVNAAIKKAEEGEER